MATVFKDDGNFKHVPQKRTDGQRFSRLRLWTPRILNLETHSVTAAVCNALILRLFLAGVFYVYTAHPSARTITMNTCQLISHCSRSMTNVIIIGDFNLPLIDWSNNVSPITRQYNSFNECFSDALTQHVNFPTRGNNTLNLILTVDPLNVTHVKAVNNFQLLDNISDHVAIVFFQLIRLTIHNPPRNIMKVTMTLDMLTLCH